MRTKWTVTTAHRIVSSTRADRLRNLRGWEACALTGRWVDVLTGRVLCRDRDLGLPGVVPLCFERHYSSAWAHRSGPLGPGWSHSLDQALWAEEDRVVCRLGDGRELELSSQADKVLGRGETLGRSELLRAPLDRLTLISVAPGFWRLQQAEGPTLLFDRVRGDRPEVSRLVSIQSQAGPELRLEYDDRARLALVTDGAGRQLRLAYDGLGRLGSLTLQGRGDQRLAVAAFGYSAEGHLELVRDALGQEQRFEVVGGLLVRRTDRCGRSTYYGYDGIGADARCLRTWADGDVDDRELRYRPAAATTSVTDSLGRRRRYVGDPVHNLLSLSGVARFDYDDDLRLQAKVDAVGYVTRFSYDARGCPATVIEPDGARWSTEHDERGRPTRVAAPNGAAWTFAWDSLGQVNDVVDPQGQLIDLDYRGGRLTRVDQQGQRTDLVYDERGDLCQVQGLGGQPRTIERDWLGRVLCSTDAEGRTTRCRRDALGRVTQVRCPDGSEHSFAYDAEGRLLRFGGPRGQTTLTYDEAGQLSSWEGPEGSLRFAFDTERRLVGLVDAEGRSWQLSRDKLGRVTSERTFEGHLWRYRYEGPSSRVAKVLAPDGGSLTLTYDLRGRVASLKTHDGLREQYRYDGAGRLLEARRGEAVVALDRDPLGRIERERSGRDWVVTCLDGQGRRSEVYSCLGARVAYLYSAGALESVLLGEAGGRGTRWQMDLEEATGPSCVEPSIVGGPLFTLDLDQVGRDGGLAARDLAGRLRRWYGLLTTQAGAEPRRGFHAAVRASADGRATFDAVGRLVEWRHPERGTWRFRYQAFRLAAVTRPDGREVTFEYDALGRRCACRRGDAELRWIWDGASPLHEISSEHALTTWCLDPTGTIALGKVEAGRYQELVERDEGRALALVDDRGGELWRVDLDGRGAPRPSGDEAAWPWLGEGLRRDRESGLLSRGSEDLFVEAGLWLTAPARGLGGAGDLAGERPWTALLAERASDESLASFLAALTTPPWPGAAGRSLLDDLTPRLPEGHPAYRFDPATATPTRLPLAELWGLAAPLVGQDRTPYSLSPWDGLDGF